MTTPSARRHVVAALSGGVDSSVAAALSNSTTAIHMSNWSLHDDDDTTCPSDREFRDAQSVAQHLQIPMRRVRFESEYWVSVFEPFLQDTATRNWTGNPDVLCNRHIKFGVLPQYLRQHWRDDDVTLVTGHYARLLDRYKNPESVSDILEEAVQSESEYDGTLDWLRVWGEDTTVPLLLSAVDDTKDQSYFLAACRGDAFRNVSFPLGDYNKNSTHNNKPSVRELATQLQLPTARKRESMGICFIGKKRKFADFLTGYLEKPSRPVRFIDIDTGQPLGETAQPSHASLYTTGQGAKISGAACKYFCIEPSLVTNTVLVCAGTHHPALYSTWLTLESLTWWTGSPPPPLVLRIQCRTRHLEALTPATLCVATMRVDFDDPVRAVTPGQYAVFYIGAVCLGGGPVASAERPAAVKELLA